MTNEFWNRCPDTDIELSSTANFVLEGSAPSGEPSFAVWYGQDASANSKEVHFSEVVTLRELADVNRVWTENLVESELIRLAEQTFEEGSSVIIHSVINIVFVLRAYQPSLAREAVAAASDDAAAPNKRRGRQIVLL